MRENLIVLPPSSEDINIRQFPHFVENSDVRVPFPVHERQLFELRPHQIMVMLFFDSGAAAFPLFRTQPGVVQKSLVGNVLKVVIDTPA